jgi:uncharacterized membrane protein YebE (DUF533 family)
MIDPEKILKQLSKGGLGGGMGGGMAGGGGLGGLGGLLGGGLGGGLLGGRRKKGGSKLAQLGTLAAVGAVAYKAYQAYQQNQAAGARAPAPGAAVPPGGVPGSGASGWGTPVNPAATAAPATSHAPAAAAAPAVDGMTLLRAMIAAAKADGQIDAAESQQIMAQVGRADLSSDEKAFLLDELAKPLNLDAVVAGVRTPQQAAEVYTASRLVIAEASAAEQAYLGLLAARLQLDPQATRELDAAVQALPG